MAVGRAAFCLAQTCGEDVYTSHLSTATVVTLSTCRVGERRCVVRLWGRVTSRNHESPKKHNSSRETDSQKASFRNTSVRRLARLNQTRIGYGNDWSKESPVVIQKPVRMSSLCDVTSPVVFRVASVLSRRRAPSLMFAQREQ